MDKTKKCSKCGMVKPASEFYKRSNRPSGLQSRCKVCQLEDRREWLSDPDARARHYEWEKEYMKEYRAKNAEKVRKNWKKRNERYMAKPSIRARRYEENRQYQYEYRQRLEVKEMNRRRQGVKDSKRRALKNSSPGNHTEDGFLELCQITGNKCLACGSSDQLQRDHVVPLSKGGCDCLYNIQPLCKGCNSGKRDYHQTDYRSPEIKKMIPDIKRGICRVHDKEVSFGD